MAALYKFLRTLYKLRFLQVRSKPQSNPKQQITNKIPPAENIHNRKQISRPYSQSGLTSQCAANLAAGSGVGSNAALAIRSAAQLAWLTRSSSLEEITPL